MVLSHKNFLTPVPKKSVPMTLTNNQVEFEAKHHEASNHGYEENLARSGSRLTTKLRFRIVGPETQE